MTALWTLLWLELRKSVGLITGVLLLLVLFAPMLSRVPASRIARLHANSGAVVSVPDEPCFGADCADSEGGTSGSWSFDWSWNSDGEQDLGSAPPSSPGAASGVGGSDFQIRYRQVVLVGTCGALTALLLLGFLVLHFRESDRGEIAILYQSPVSGDAQLWARFAFIGVSVAGVIAAVFLAYAALQASQGLASFGPAALGYGISYSIDWINLAGVAMILWIFPAAAFILLFCQIQNAYGLLDRRRLSGLALILAWVQCSLLGLRWIMAKWSESGVWIWLLRREDLAQGRLAAETLDLDSVVVRLPGELLLLGLAVTGVMMFFSGRIWKEVEWS